jgi:oligopeptide/dipeptide ABC transporter ATP-binding protein
MAIIYTGTVVEYGPVKKITENAYHPYTLALLRAFPSIRGKKEELVSIPGTPPSLLHLPKGCFFEERCPFSEAICKKKPPELIRVEEGHYSACHMADRVEGIRKLCALEETWQ